jgi:hypothetical protein
MFKKLNNEEMFVKKGKEKYRKGINLIRNAK